MAAISRDDVAHLAKLARIEMTPAELDHMASELEQILGAVKRVQEVATSDIAPTSHPLSMSNVFRDDVVKPSLTNDEALSGAPAQAEEILGEE